MPSLSCSPDPQAFYEQVWNIVRQIPYGKVAAYGQIAKMITPPNGVEIESYADIAPRWGGGDMANCPDDVPWERVINSQGKISEREGAARQRLLLEEEGVQFDAKDRVDMKKYGWTGKKDDEGAVQPPLL